MLIRRPSSVQPGGALEPIHLSLAGTEVNGCRKSSVHATGCAKMKAFPFDPKICNSTRIINSTFRLKSLATPPKTSRVNHPRFTIVFIDFAFVLI